MQSRAEIERSYKRAAGFGIWIMSSTVLYWQQEVSHLCFFRIPTTTDELMAQEFQWRRK